MNNVRLERLVLIQATEKSDGDMASVMRLIAQNQLVARTVQNLATNWSK